MLQDLLWAQEESVHDGADFPSVRHRINNKSTYLVHLHARAQSTSAGGYSVCQSICELESELDLRWSSRA